MELNTLNMEPITIQQIQWRNEQIKTLEIFLDCQKTTDFGNKKKDRDIQNFTTNRIIKMSPFEIN